MAKSAGELRRRATKRALEQAAYAAAMAPLLASGASCATCEHLIRRPPIGMRGVYCDLDSDYSGWQEVRPTDCCPRYAGQLKEGE